MSNEQGELCPCGAHTKPGALWQCIRGHNILEEQRSQATPAADRLTDTGEGETLLAAQQVQSSVGMWDKLNERTDPKDAWVAYGEQLRHDAMRLVAALATPKPPVDAGAMRERIARFFCAFDNDGVASVTVPQNDAFFAHWLAEDPQYYEAADALIRNLSDDGETM